jgi:hypothetical protein
MLMSLATEETLTTGGVVLTTGGVPGGPGGPAGPGFGEHDAIVSRHSDVPARSDLRNMEILL